MTPTLASYYHTMDPIIFRIYGDLAVRWYGVGFIASFTVAYFVLRYLARTGRSPLAENRIFDVLLSLVMGVLLGGRLGYCILYEHSLITSFNSSFPFWGVLRLTQGGMSFHGGLAGVLIATMLVSRGTKNPDGTRTGKMSPLALFDALALATPFGILLVRCANFINGELLGKIVSPPGQPGPWWSVKFPHEITSGQELQLTSEQSAQLETLIRTQSLASDKSIDEAANRLLSRILAGDNALAAKLEPFISSRHPSQLYEALGEGLCVGIILWLAFLFKPRIGIIGPLFMMTYAISRFVSEFWRLPDSHLAHQHIMGLSRGQLFSSFMFLLGAGVIAYVLSRGKPVTGVQAN